MSTTDALLMAPCGAAAGKDDRLHDRIRLLLLLSCLLLSWLGFSFPLAEAFYPIS